MTPLRKRALKRKIKRVWNDWRISPEELGWFAEAIGIFVMLYGAYVIGSIFV